MNLNVDDDYLIFDNTEAVTVTLNRSGTAEEVVVSNALRRALTREDRRTVVALKVDNTIWNIAVTQLGATKTLKNGDTITAGTEIWHVEAVTMNTWRTRWRAVCTLGR